MRPFVDFTTLIAGQREVRANLKTLLSCVMPRPIALVSTVSAEGVANLAPFSFFNAVGSNPPAIIFSPSTRGDGTQKDTIVNLRAVPECVVNVVPRAICEAMNNSSYSFPPGVNEFEAVGFTPLPSRLVRPRRVAESPVHMECSLIQIVTVGDGALSANICIAQVLCFHIASDVLLSDGTADAGKIDLVGRLGGDDYSTIRDRFVLSKPAAPRVSPLG